MIEDGQAGTTSSPRRWRGRVAIIDGPDPIDVHVGGRLRLRRVLMGMRQMALGEQVGLTFQQIQKYERGANRISASTLYRLAHVLDVPVSFFFDGMAGNWSSSQITTCDMNLAKAETVQLLKCYYRVADAPRKCILQLLRAIARPGSGGEENSP